MLRWTAAVLFVLGLLAVLQEVHGCNEAVCGSIVSKCLLTQSCKCDFEKDCSCCKECANCLSTLYNECCSCVGMCPKPNDTTSTLNKQSHVEDFPKKFSSLFDALTEGPDSLSRWTSFMFPVDFKILAAPKNDIKLQMQSIEQETLPIKSNITTLNCTVAFIADCTSWEKCKEQCSSMGASSMRWFHDGCCECVGENCINYGINDSRCIKCSDKELEDLPEEDKDYGEEDFDDLEDEEN